MASPSSPPTGPVTVEVTTASGTASASTTRDGWEITTTVPPTETYALGEVLRACAEAVSREGGGRLTYWIENASGTETDTGPQRAHFEPVRNLHQMRVKLPVPNGELVTRAFTDADADAFLAVNNRAFDWHPEQSDMTTADLAERQDEPWYDPDGFRLAYLEDNPEPTPAESDPVADTGTSGLIGFCWTKIHHTQRPKLGEIYVIGVDPAHHGKGLGEALTRAGLRWLSDQGIRQGMLYVESDNHKALATYERIGFTVHSTNRAYQLTV